MKRWGGKPPVLTQEQASYIRQLSHIKKMLPTYEQLAEKWGVSLHTIDRYTRNPPKRYGR